MFLSRQEANKCFYKNTDSGVDVYYGAEYIGYMTKEPGDTGDTVVPVPCLGFAMSGPQLFNDGVRFLLLAWRKETIRRTKTEYMVLHLEYRGEWLQRGVYGWDAVRKTTQNEGMSDSEWADAEAACKENGFHMLEQDTIIRVKE